jgi:hypothetical protein
MIGWILAWLPWLPPLLLSGIFNFLVAYQKLYRDCRSPLFRPWRSFGFWCWILLQITLPAIIFYFYGNISSKPPIDFSLYWTAILIGFFFTMFVNANADIGFVNFSVDKLYAFLNQIVYDLIAANQTGQLADFKRDLNQELLQNQTDLDEGLNWLRAYFDSDIGLKNEPQERTALLEEVDQALAQNIPSDKVKAAIALILKVRRKDCQRLLRRLKCSQKFLQTYFSRR